MCQPKKIPDVTPVYQNLEPVQEVENTDNVPDEQDFIIDLSDPESIAQLFPRLPISQRAREGMDIPDVLRGLVGINAVVGALSDIFIRAMQNRENWIHTVHHVMTTIQAMVQQFDLGPDIEPTGNSPSQENQNESQDNYVWEDFDDRNLM